MRTLTLVLTAALLCAAQIALAAPSEDEQDRQYTNCLIKIKADPKQLKRSEVDGCLVEAGVEYPGKEAYRTAFSAWRECLTPKILQFDDGVSPAVEIAKAVAPMCSTEWAAFVAANWLPPSARHGLLSEAATSAVPGVLLVRNTRRAVDPSK